MGGWILKGRPWALGIIGPRRCSRSPTSWPNERAGSASAIRAWSNGGDIRASYWHDGKLRGGPPPARTAACRGALCAHPIPRRPYIVGASAASLLNSSGV